MYIFGIHNLIEDKGCMHMWDGTVVKWGSSKVASCLNYFFQTYRMGVWSLVSSSDGWGGQNKNLTIVNLYNKLHLYSGVYIPNHKFLTRGHTFLRNDSVCHQIKKRKASATMYLLSDWSSVVKETKRQNSFKVVNMQQGEFLT